MSFLEIQTSKHFLSRKFSRYTRVKKISAHIFCLYGPVRPKKINGFSRSKEFNQGVGCTRNFKANFTNALIGLILSKIAQIDELKNSWAPKFSNLAQSLIGNQGRQQNFTLSTSDGQLPKNAKNFLSK